MPSHSPLSAARPVPSAPPSSAPHSTSLHAPLPPPLRPEHAVLALYTSRSPPHLFSLPAPPTALALRNSFLTIIFTSTLRVIVVLPPSRSSPNSQCLPLRASRPTSPLSLLPFFLIIFIFILYSQYASSSFPRVRVIYIYISFSFYISRARMYDRGGRRILLIDSSHGF
ncbi:hypothetical protein C8R44DRAFT_796565 [Mycena epipterygia]|nr:hypothetical protein C8R44DRAFT_796565 [Mycena epipterygia]